MHSIGELLKLIEIHMKKNFEHQFQAYGITRQQAHVLWVLHHNNECLSQKELREILKVTHPTMVGIINRLETAGYVQTCPAPEDKRITLVKATEKAVGMHEELGRKRQRMDEILNSGFSDEEKEQLTTLLNRVLENIEKESDIDD